MFCFDFPPLPYGFGSFGFFSDLSSSVEFVVGSTKTESDEEDYLVGLTRQMTHSTIEDDFKRNDLSCNTEKIKILLPLCFFLK